MLTLMLAALALTVLAALISAGEASFGRTSSVRAEELHAEGRGGSGALVKVVDDSAAYLSVLAFVRVLAEVGAVVAFTLGSFGPLSRGWAALASVVVMSLVLFAAAEVAPRILASQKSSTIALLAAPGAVWIRRILGPISRLVIAVTNALTPGRGAPDGPFDSEAELRDLVDRAQVSSVIEADERRMIHSVFELDDTLTREVMVPRTDMVSIEGDRVARQAMSLFIRSGFSRVPVFGEGADDVIGMLYFKDVVRRVTAKPAAADEPITDLMRPVTFVPDSKPVDALLRDMQVRQVQVAVVVDEYGGTAGLVTMEDIIEEIVGEITDEYDRDEPVVEDLGDGRLRVPAALHLDDLAEATGVESLEDEDVDTVGGLIAKTIGKVPIVGSVAEVDGLRLTAERMSGRRHRISSVLVERVPAAERSDDPAAIQEAS